MAGQSSTARVIEQADSACRPAQSIRALVVDDDEDVRQLFIESAKEVDKDIICTPDI